MHMGIYQAREQVMFKRAVLLFNRSNTPPCQHNRSRVNASSVDIHYVYMENFHLSAKDYGSNCFICRYFDWPVLLPEQPNTCFLS